MKQIDDSIEHYLNPQPDSSHLQSPTIRIHSP